MGLVAIGLRNIARNHRRSVLTITALGLGVAVMIIGLGWIRGYYTTIYGGVKSPETGDVQVLRDGYLDQERRLPLDLLIPDAASVARRIAADPSVSAVAPRIDFSATVGTEAGSVRVLGRAIDPAAEAEVTTIERLIQQGSYLADGERRHPPRRSAGSKAQSSCGRAGGTVGGRPIFGPRTTWKYLSRGSFASAFPRWTTVWSSLT